MRLLALCLACLALPALAGDYNRADWPHWDDADGDCISTRHEVLIRDAIRYEMDARGCRVVAGLWIGPYTGKAITDPSLIDADHVVPLAESHRSGAADWPPEKKRAYANWMPGLLAVDRSANRQKGAKDPAGWMPAVEPCIYARRWVLIKARWALTMDPAERIAVSEILASCE